MELLSKIILIMVGKRRWFSDANIYSQFCPPYFKDINVTIVGWELLTVILGKLGDLKAMPTNSHKLILVVVIDS